MSALPPKADMCGANSEVRFGSKADICNAKWHVRFTPKSGPLPALPLELKATSGTVTVRIAENGFATSRS